MSFLTLAGVLAPIKPKGEATIATPVFKDSNGRFFIQELVIDTEKPTLDFEPPFEQFKVVQATEINQIANLIFLTSGYPKKKKNDNHEYLICYQKSIFVNALNFSFISDTPMIIKESQSIFLAVVCYGNSPVVLLEELLVPYVTLTPFENWKKSHQECLLNEAIYVMTSPQHA